MVLACCYLLTATVLLPNGVREQRRYYGIFKVKANQTRTSAAAKRLERRIATPVKWLRLAIANTMQIHPIGHVMSLEEALTQEAVFVAQALNQGGQPCRGGPWSCPHVGAQGRKEAAEVRRLAARAPDAAAARASVIAYARELSEKSYLRKHIEDKSFRIDSAEEIMGPPARKRKKLSPSGNNKRKRKGLKPGTAAYNAHKWGSDVVANRSRDNEWQNSKRGKKTRN